jgi:FtsH-binding integral membrane protein
MMVSLGGIAGTLIGFIGCNFMSPNLVSYREKGELIHKTTNSPLRLGLFGLGVTGLGLSASPLFAMYSQLNPAILPASCAISAAIFGSASLYAYL